MPRPMGHQLTATKPMEVIALDFMTIGDSRGDEFKYILVIVDQLSRISAIDPTKDNTASTAARILVKRWLEFFPDPVFIITDGGTHFKNTLFQEIERLRGFTHHIVAPYSQWSNGGAERLNQVFLKAMRALLHSRKENWDNWPRWTSAINGALNKTLKVSSRGNKTPMEILTGLPPKAALRHIVWRGVEADVAEGVPHQEFLRALAGMHEALEGLWQRASEAMIKRQQQNDKLRNKRVHHLPRINVGDGVLVAEHKKRHKLVMTWTGPHEVIRTLNNFVYEVRPMVRNPGKRKPIIAHVVRIRRLFDAELGSEIDMKEIERSARADFPENIVGKLVNHKMENDDMLIRVRWLGYTPAFDSFEPIHSLVEDVPRLVKQYLKDRVHKEECAAVLQQYFPGPV